MSIAVAGASSPEESDDQASLGEQLEGALGQLLNVVIPAAPANAQSLDGKTDSDYSGMQTAEMLSAAMRRPGSVDLGPSTPGLPQQGAAAVTARPVPTQINNPNHPYFVAIGLNEGTRTANGGYTRAYYGHTQQSGWQVLQTVARLVLVHGSPQQADRQWASILSGRAIEARAFLRKAGLADNTVGFQRVMFNVLDLMVQVGQYSGANDDFLVGSCPRCRQLVSPSNQSPKRELIPTSTRPLDGWKLLVLAIATTGCSKTNGNAPAPSTTKRGSDGQPP